MEKIHLTKENIPKIADALTGIIPDGVLFRTEDNCLVFKCTLNAINVYDIDDGYIGDNYDKEIIVKTFGDIEALKKYYNDDMVEAISLLKLLKETLGDDICIDIAIFGMTLYRFIGVLSNDLMLLRDTMESLNFQPTYYSDVPGDDDRKVANKKEANFNLLAILHKATEETKEELIKINILPMVLGKILDKRIKAYKLEQCISNDAMLFWFALNIDNPGKIMVYLIDLLDFCSVHNRPAVLEDLSTTIYPLGFYDTNTFNFIIKNIIKEDRTLHGFIY